MINRRLLQAMLATALVAGSVNIVSAAAAPAKATGRSWSVGKIVKTTLGFLLVATARAYGANATAGTASIEAGGSGTPLVLDEDLDAWVDSQYVRSFEFCNKGIPKYFADSGGIFELQYIKSCEKAILYWSEDVAEKIQQARNAELLAEKIQKARNAELMEE